MPTHTPGKRGNIDTLLMACKESRCVLLRQYLIVNKTKSYCICENCTKLGRGRLFGISATNDELYLSAEQLDLTAIQEWKDVMSNLTPYREMRITSFLGNIRILEITDLFWHEGLQKGIVAGFGSGICKRLTSLQTLHLNLSYTKADHAFYAPGYTHPNHKEEAVVRAFQHEFQKLIQQDTALKLPKIVLHEIRMERVRTLEEKGADLWHVQWEYPEVVKKRGQ